MKLCGEIGLPHPVFTDFPVWDFYQEDPRYYDSEGFKGAILEQAAEIYEVCAREAGHPGVHLSAEGPWWEHQVIGHAGPTKPPPVLHKCGEPATAFSTSKCLNCGCWGDEHPTVCGGSGCVCRDYFRP